jgi:hypothetical protein
MKVRYSFRQATAIISCGIALTRIEDGMFGILHHNLGIPAECAEQ